MMETFLVGIDDVKRITAVTQNVDAKHIQPYLKTAQQLRMMPHLGLVFVQSITAAIATRNVIASATQANPVVITTDTAHGFATGNSINVADATGMEGINGQHTITVLTSTTFELDGLDGTAFPAYNAGTAAAMKMSAADAALLPYLQDACAWWVVRDAIPFIYMHITNSTIVVQGIASASGRFGGDGGTAIDSKGMQWMVQNCQNIAEGFTRILLDFLSIHSADYPLWVQSCTVSSSLLGGSGNQGSGQTGMSGTTGNAYRRPFRPL